MVGPGRPWAVGERVAGDPKAQGRLWGAEEGLLHKVGSSLSLKGWRSLKQWRAVCGDLGPSANHQHHLPPQEP